MPVRAALANGAIALAIGAAALALAGAAGTSDGLSWSDEITYATVGRNIAAGRGPISSFSHPDAILARGFPLRDVHMPAHAYALALGFRVFGPADAAAVAVSRTAFLLAGVLVSCTALRVFGQPAGVWAAALFSFFPGLAAYANSAMSEATLLLLTAAWWLLWCAGLASGRPILAAVLGLLLAVGATHRETFVALVPAGIYALTRWPGARRRAALLAAGCFAVWMAAVFFPLYRARPPYPHALSFLLDATAQSGTGHAIAETLWRNVKPWSRPDVWLWVYALEWVCAAAAAALALRSSRLGRRLGTWGAATFLVTFAALAPLYWLRGWTAVRMFLYTVPPCVVLLAAAVGAPARRLRRHAVPAAALLAFVAADIVANSWLARDRQAEATRGRAYAAYIRVHTAGAAPRVVIAAAAHRYGWEEYPVAVIDADIDASRLVALASRVEVDAIVTRRHTPHFLAVLREHGYVRRSVEPFEGRHVYLRQPGLALSPPALTLDRPTPVR
jgi:hypothetical protein